MKDQEIDEFVKAFEDFMKHAEVQELYHDGWVTAKQYAKEFFEEKALELNIHVDYYIMEFV
jgi:hypothetical protein